MKIFNLFKKKSTKKETKVRTSSEINSYFENKEDFHSYKKHLSEKYAITEIDAFLLITQTLFAYHYFDIYRVRDLELNLNENNVEEYKQERINLDKIHRLFLFLYITRTHELKDKYQEWMGAYYNKYKKPIFRRGERNRMLPEVDFIEFVYQKILEWQE